MFAGAEDVYFAGDAVALEGQKLVHGLVHGHGGVRGGVEQDGGRGLAADVQGGAGVHPLGGAVGGFMPVDRLHHPGLRQGVRLHGGVEQNQRFRAQPFGVGDALPDARLHPAVAVAGGQVGPGGSAEEHQMPGVHVKLPGPAADVGHGQGHFPQQTGEGRRLGRGGEGGVFQQKGRVARVAKALGDGQTLFRGAGFIAAAGQHHDGGLAQPVGQQGGQAHGAVGIGQTKLACQHIGEPSFPCFSLLRSVFLPIVYHAAKRDCNSFAKKVK